MDRLKPAQFSVVRCPECGACMELDPLFMARDLAIVSALLQELDDKNISANQKELLDKLARKSVDLCTGLGFYGYDYLAEAEEPK